MVDAILQALRRAVFLTVEKGARALLLATVAACATPVHADVNSFGGFEESVAIKLPAAVAGLQPGIGLVYDSQRGDGLVGVGWSLTGFPSIARMNYGAGINYNAGDTFVGPGGRLVNFNGSHDYRTEDESWARYVPYNADGSVWSGGGGCNQGPCYWRVTQPDGSVQEFGATSDSRIEAAGRGGAVREWALSKVIDTRGNFYTVAYEEEGTIHGYYLPTLVTYNQGNGRTLHYKVELSYEDRIDVAPEFSQSARVRAHRRLKWINVKGGGQLLRKYRLDYEYGATTGVSRLIAIQEYGRAPGSVRPAHSFRYQEGTAAWTAHAEFPHWGPSTGLVDNVRYPVLTGDWNGDGKADIARVRNAGLVFQTSTGTAWLYHPDLPGWGPDHGLTNGNKYPVFTGDWNGDGKTDVGRVYEDGVMFQVSTGGGWAAYSGLVGWSPRAGFTDANTYPLLIGDWNGDGRTDLGRVHNLGIQFQVSTGTGWQPYADGPAWSGNNNYSDATKYPIVIGDWNGDGKADIGRVYDGGVAFAISTGSGWASYGTIAGWGPAAGLNDSDKYPIFTGDWNGDGKDDLGRVHLNGIAFRVSTGTDWQGYADGPAWGPSNLYADVNKYPVVTGDWNGDGKDDIGRVYNSGVAFQVSTGEGWRDFATHPHWGPNEAYADSNSYPFLSGDWTGEGKSGLGRVYHAGIQFITRAGPLPDLLTAVVNEMGGTTAVTYLPSTQVAGAIRPDLATCGSASPSLCGNASAGSLPLVTRVVVTDGRNNTYSTRYEYFNRRHLPGVPSVAEALGFERQTAIDEQLGIQQRTSYRQDHPFHGRVAEVAEFVGATRGPVVRVQSFNYEQISSSYATRLIRKVSEELTQYEGVRAMPAYRTRTLYEHDSFGNVTLTSNLADVATAADDVYTSSAYINDLAQWRIGLPYALDTCADAACALLLQRTRNRYDERPLGQVGAHAALSGSSVWRSDTNTYLASTFAYNAAGAVVSRTDASGAIVESNEYDPAAGWLVRSTDAVGNTSISEYDPVSGDPLALTDVNGNTTRYSYDAFGRKNRTEAPHDGSSSSVVEDLLSFNPNLHVLKVHTDRGVLVTTRHLDGLGRAWKITQTWDNGSLLQSDTFFDAAGREYRKCAARLSTQPLNESSCTTTYFDARGRTARVETPRFGGGFAAVTYEHDGYRTAVTDPAGHTTVTEYDPATLTTTLTQPGGLVTRTQADLLGRVVSVVDPQGNSDNRRYNSLGWKLSDTDPVTGTTLYEYDAIGRLAAQTDAAGVRTNMYYDTGGRILRTDYAPLNATSAGSEDTVMKYDFLTSPGDVANARGKLVRVQDRSGSVLFAYDAAGRARTLIRTIDGVQYATTATYDRAGKRTAVTYPDGSVVRYRHETDAQHLSSITLDGVEIMRYAGYNERGAPTSLVYGDRIDEVSLTFEAATGALQRQSDTRDFVSDLYERDERGMLVAERDMRAAKPNGDTSKAYAYDALGQLVGAAMGADAICGTACTGSAWSKAYSYDSTGRVLEKDGKRFSYDVSRRFQLTRVSGETADRTYDAVGRLTSKRTAAGALESYVNGSDGFLREHRREGTVLHRMTYDYKGLRTRKEFFGTNPQTTLDLDGYRIVHDRNSGKYYHTLYVMGLHGARIAHRTTQKPGMAAATASGGYQDRALASVYSPSSLGGFLPWARHQGAATAKTLLNDLDGARGAAATLIALALLVSIVACVAVCLAQLLSVVRGWRHSVPSRRSHLRWLAPGMLCVASAACIGNYETQPHEQATADALGKDARYGLLEALSRGGTNQPVPGTFYYLNSPQGSTKVMFDPQGAALLRLEYFPDGVVNTAASRGSYVAAHTYGQKEYDKELEAYYNAFRYYDAETLRFTAPDAIKESGDFLVHNTYAYTRNNPVNYIDPTGFATMRHDGGSSPSAPGTHVPPSGARQIDSSTGPRAAPRYRANYYPRQRPANPTRTGPFNRGPDGGPQQGYLRTVYGPKDVRPDGRGEVPTMDEADASRRHAEFTNWLAEQRRITAMKANDGTIWTMGPNGHVQQVMNSSQITQGSRLLIMSTNSAEEVWAQMIRYLGEHGVAPFVILASNGWELTATPVLGKPGALIAMAPQSAAANTLTRILQATDGYVSVHNWGAADHQQKGINQFAAAGGTYHNVSTGGSNFAPTPALSLSQGEPPFGGGESGSRFGNGWVDARGEFMGPNDGFFQRGLALSNSASASSLYPNAVSLHGGPIGDASSARPAMRGGGGAGGAAGFGACSLCFRQK